MPGKKKKLKSSVLQEQLRITPVTDQLHLVAYLVATDGLIPLMETSDLQNNGTH